jgi:hypothetical protein
MSKKSPLTPATAPVRLTIEETVSSGLMSWSWARPIPMRTVGFVRSTRRWWMLRGPLEVITR